MITAQRIPIKHSNRKVILDIFRISSVLSVADVSSTTGISKPTVQKVINHFIEAGYIIPEGKGESTDEGGKKPKLYSFNQMYGYVLCIHLGPDFLYSAVTDLKNEIILSEYHQVEVLTVDKLISMCADTIKAFCAADAVKDSRLLSIAVALPGIVDPEDGSLIYTPHFPELGNNYSFVEELGKKVELKVPVYCDNINRFQAFGEMKLGKAVGSKNFIIIDAMEEGLGSGIIVNGSLKHGHHNFSGEIGHMVLMPVSGPDCICGGRGCFEALVSVRRINELINEGRSSNGNSKIFANEMTGPLLSRLFAAFAQGDEFASIIMDEIAFWFASGINNVFMVNDPELIILEGIYNQVGEPFIEKIKYHMERIAYPGIRRTVHIEFSDFGAERGLIGAGAYAVWAFFNRPEFYSG